MCKVVSSSPRKLGVIGSVHCMSTLTYDILNILDIFIDFVQAARVEK